MNLYGFVRNDPITRVDADGHQSPGAVITWADVLTAAEGGEVLGPEGALALGGGALAGYIATHGGGPAYPMYYHREDNLYTVYKNSKASSSTKAPAQQPSGQSTPASPQGQGPKKDDGPKLISNPKHNQNSASPEPKNAQDLFKNSIVDKNGVRWAKDADGTIHRFSAPSNGESHWNGSTAGDKPIKTDNIPIYIRKALK